MSQSATTEKFVQQTSAKNPITGPVYMSKAPRSTEYFDRGVSENFVSNSRDLYPVRRATYPTQPRPSECVDTAAVRSSN